jgi:[acyl-carrier-protein] S-malonyltransferase
MSKLAILFAGQGGQYPGMGLDWVQGDPVLQSRLQTTSSILGFDFESLLRGTDDSIHETRYAQPAIVFSSLAAYGTLVQATGVLPVAMTGFSLGEYTALSAAGVFSFSEIMTLLNVRSIAMQAAANRQMGGMSAVLGLTSEVVEAICFAVSVPGSIVVPANYNCPGQLVISGHVDAVAKANEQAKIAGAKRCVVLNVRGAFHSPLMEMAIPSLCDALSSLPLWKPKIPIYANVTGLPYVFTEIKEILCKQLVSPVLFEQTIRHMRENGITHFLEIGPGSTLSGLVRKIDPEAIVTNLDKKEQLDTVKGWLKTYGLIE